jgi:hypothetical protein
MERIVAENWGVLVSAPLAFLAALCLGVAIGWVVVGLIYNQRVAAQDHTITNLRAVIEEKFPVSVIIPRHSGRTKRMTWGLVLLFVGLGAAVVGAVLIGFERPPKQQLTKIEPPPVQPNEAAKTVQSPLPPSVPLPSVTSTEREFTTRTPRELLALYEGRSMLEADQLIKPYKGKWIQAKANILQIIPNGDGTVVILKDGDKIISCPLVARWTPQLLKMRIGDPLSVIGQVGISQNGQQLYLQDCEIV